MPHTAKRQVELTNTGFGNTMRYIAVVTAMFAITINVVTRLRIPPRRSGPIVDWKAFTEIPFLTFSIGFFLIYWASYFAFYYVSSSLALCIASANESDRLTLMVMLSPVSIHETPSI